ncbi:MAG: rubredoxin [Eubacteriaceae bacterium]|nr:rubredoxin [Eubacteriaceae bacterium]
MRYVCQVCGYVYDDEKEGVSFASLPDDWQCPLCGARKSDFRPEEPSAAAEVKESRPQRTYMEETDEKLSAGQLAALMSNLARGCEKQYKAEEAAMFAKIADHLTRLAAPAEDATVERLARMLKEDVEAYPQVRSQADLCGDRGAARICVWGEKVTRMLSSLTERYLAEGDSMLQGREIWLCTVCGFVYIGKDPPEKCPVCKVPSWKFEKVQGRKNA